MVAYLKDQRKECQASGKPGQSKNQQSTNKVKETATDTAPQQSDKDKKAEFAGKASSKSPTLSTDTNNEWNADTGASTHMTPHREWL